MVEEAFTPVSPVKKPGRVAFTTLERCVELLRARAYTVPLPREIVKVELGIDAKTKHIYKLLQTGTNSSKTTFTITTFNSNQTLSENFFKFDEQKYLDQNYTID